MCRANDSDVSLPPLVVRITELPAVQTLAGVAARLAVGRTAAAARALGEHT